MKQAVIAYYGTDTETYRARPDGLFDWVSHQTNACGIVARLPANAVPLSADLVFDVEFEE